MSDERKMYGGVRWPLPSVPPSAFGLSVAPSGSLVRDGWTYCGLVPGVVWFPDLHGGVEGSGPEVMLEALDAMVKSREGRETVHLDVLYDWERIHAEAERLMEGDVRVERRFSEREDNETGAEPAVEASVSNNSGDNFFGLVQERGVRTAKLVTIGESSQVIVGILREGIKNLLLKVYENDEAAVIQFLESKVGRDLMSVGIPFAAAWVCHGRDLSTLRDLALTAAEANVARMGFENVGKIREGAADIIGDMFAQISDVVSVGREMMGGLSDLAGELPDNEMARAAEELERLRVAVPVGGE